MLCGWDGVCGGRLGGWFGVWFSVRFGARLGARLAFVGWLVVVGNVEDGISHILGKMLVDGGRECGDLILNPFQLLCVVVVEYGGEGGHAAPKTSLLRLFVLMGQVDPRLKVDGETFG